MSTCYENDSSTTISNDDDRDNNDNDSDHDDNSNDNNYDSSNHNNNGNWDNDANNQRNDTVFSLQSRLPFRRGPRVRSACPMRLEGIRTNHSGQFGIGDGNASAVLIVRYPIAPVSRLPAFALSARNNIDIGKW